MSVRDAAWQAQRELIREEVRRIVNPIRERISAMTLSEIIDQLESGDDVTAITRTLQLEVEEEARRKFADRLQAIRSDTTARLKKEAEAEAEDEARILQEEWKNKSLDEHRARAHSKAWTEELKHWTDLFAGRVLRSVGRSVRRGRWGVCPECRQESCGDLPCYIEASTTERCWDRGGRDAHRE
jgi:quinol monooxygenase YgiN